MSKKKYSQQCGPNLVFYDCSNEPDSAVMHKNCGGMFVQNLGPPNQKSHDKPDNSPGKILCVECGHKVSRTVSASLKMGTGSEHFYFPDRSKYELCARTYIDMNSVLRYWEWNLKDGPGLPEAVSRELRGAKHRLSKMKKNIKRLAPKTTITQEDGDWILTHPRITMRMPMDQFDGDDVYKVFLAWKSSDNIDKSTEELEKIARDILDIEFVAIMNTPEFFGIVEGSTVVIMRRPAWGSVLVGKFANNIRGMTPEQIENCASIFASAHNKEPGSITIEEDFLEKMLDENPPLEEPVNPCAEVEVPAQKGPFAGQTDMAIRQDKRIISYARGYLGLYWFLTLNNEIWGNDLAQEVRKMIRSNVYQTPEALLSAMVSTARILGNPTDLNSFQVSLDLEEAESILFNPLEQDINF